MSYEDVKFWVVMNATVRRGRRLLFYVYAVGIFCESDVLERCYDEIARMIIDHKIPLPCSPS